eukprot:973125-Prorocentrum_minimum.AAC.1
MSKSTHPIKAGTGGYTRDGNQSEQRREDIPGAGTNRSRDGSIISCDLARNVDNGFGPSRLSFRSRSCLQSRFV